MMRIRNKDRKSIGKGKAQLPSMDSGLFGLFIFYANVDTMPSTTESVAFDTARKNRNDALVLALCVL